MAEKYEKTDKMYEMICQDYNLLQVISRFGLPLGFADKTIEEVCGEQEVDCETFLAVVNFTKYGLLPHNTLAHISIRTLCDYLRQSHSYYLDFLLPSIRRNLIEALGFCSHNDVAILIVKFFDEFFVQVRKHLETENKNVFPYIDSLLSGKKIKPIALQMSLLHQVPIEDKLSELKNIIIKYYSSESNNNLLNSTLHNIFMCEEDLRSHCELEDRLFIPQVESLEEKIKRKQDLQPEDEEDGSATLTEREKEIISCVVKGLTNKEIADKLFISINTVTTHRRNIARKLDIHSPSGLTIYAIVNKLVDISEIDISGSIEE